MFCNNCGKEIPDKTLFCTYCGEKVVYSAKVGTKSSNGKNAGGIQMMISVVVSAIVAISFLILACIEAEKNADIFGWFDDVVMVMGCVLHWGICVLIVVQSTMHIYLLRKKNSASLFAKFGIMLATEGVVFKILDVVSNNDQILSNGVFCVLYRVFHITYGNAAWINIIMGIILIIFGTQSKKTLAK